MTNLDTRSNRKLEADGWKIVGFIKREPSNLLLKGDLAKLMDECRTNDISYHIDTDRDLQRGLELIDSIYMAAHIVDTKTAKRITSRYCKSYEDAVATKVFQKI